MLQFTVCYLITVGILCLLSGAPPKLTIFVPWFGIMVIWTLILIVPNIFAWIWKAVRTVFGNVFGFLFTCAEFLWNMFARLTMLFPYFASFARWLVEIRSWFWFGPTTIDSWRLRREFSRRQWAIRLSQLPQNERQDAERDLHRWFREEMRKLLVR